MVRIELEPEEQQILATVLASYLSDLRMEISHTDRADFRDMLKERKAVVEKALRAVSEPAAGAGGGARPGSG
jgi:hypothetical protein